jgi:hypothetical protein
MIDRGELRAVRIGSRRVRVRKSDLQRFIDAGGDVQGEPEAGTDRGELARALEDAGAVARNGHDDEKLAAALRRVAAAADALASAIE